MLRRRYRLSIFTAIAVFFSIYSLMQSSWIKRTAFETLQTTSQKERPLAGAVPEKTNPNQPKPKQQGWSEEHYGQYDVADAKSKAPEPVREKQNPTDVDISKGKLGTYEDVHEGEEPATPTAETDYVRVAGDKFEKVEKEDPLLLTEPPTGLKNDPNKNRPKVHWKKPKENFPLPKASIASLPTGSPRSIPKIQYEFDPESETAKTKRLQRLNKVKAEIEKAWSGYKQYAWMHDELAPVSAKFRDPFCGWAASLVDSLDTLWIAGLKDEFEEAVKAVKKIDFTWTQSNEIPVFEVTIRYLGGLLGAYDVSGGQYPILLDKAIELGEILFGIFDTPNRMPVLYYTWRPELASLPRLAGRVGIAELATLSVEFTRLAQLTKEHRYYDAIDRITDALVDLQKRGTAIPGLFPQGIDATGCNKTATDLRNSASKASREQLSDESKFKQPENYAPKTKNDNARETSTKKVVDIKPRAPPPKRPGEVRPDDIVQKPQETASAESEATSSFAVDGKSGSGECVPQGLVPSGYGYQSFHMGGGQDSAYEYFAKEYLLLGGLEPKYKKLHVDAVEAVSEWLLYRPMSDDDWEVLFPAKVALDQTRAMDAEYEVTHLTCFVGGMYALGGKVFDREEDVEIAAQLTDGCVWAYQLTASGLMPEVSRVLPCPTLQKCEFNRTLWWDTLDAARSWRDTKKAELAAKKKEDEARIAHGEKQDTEDTKSHRPQSDVSNEKIEEAQELKKAAEDFSEESISDLSSDHIKRAAVPLVESGTKDEGSLLPDSLKQKLSTSHDNNAKDGTSKEPKLTSTTDEKEANPDKKQEVPSIPSQNTPAKASDYSDRSAKTLSHDEYVKDRIKKDRLPPGFTSISSRYYILRPEAIESVWYMYRITGDPEWMDKGWRMFEATLKATSTEFGHSAVDDVTKEKPELIDTMESFWIAETLKYYYLLFSEPDVISLDDWILNTEAHPLKRPDASSSLKSARDV